MSPPRCHRKSAWRRVRDACFHLCTGPEACPPELPQEDLLEYVKVVSAIDGITIVTGSLVRSSPNLLMSIASKPCPGIEGATETMVQLLAKVDASALGHVARAELWKEKFRQQQEAAKAAAAAAAAAGGVGATAGGAAAEAAAAAENENAAAAMDVDAEPAVAADPEDLEAMVHVDESTSGRRKKTLPELAVDHVSTFAVVVKGHFLAAVAKSSHSSLRRGTESASKPPLSARTASLALALGLKTTVVELHPSKLVTQASIGGWVGWLGSVAAADSVPHPSQDLISRIPSMGEEEIRQVSGQVASWPKVVDQLSSVLVDPKRAYCHALVLNFFVQGGGLEQALTALAPVARLLEAVVPLKRAEVAKEDASQKQRAEFVRKRCVPPGPALPAGVTCADPAPSPAPQGHLPPAQGIRPARGPVPQVPRGDHPPLHAPTGPGLPPHLPGDDPVPPADARGRWARRPEAGPRAPLPPDGDHGLRCLRAALERYLPTPLQPQGRQRPADAPVDLGAAPGSTPA